MALPLLPLPCSWPVTDTGESELWDHVTGPQRAEKRNTLYSKMKEDTPPEYLVQEHKTNAIETWFDESGMKEFKWLAQRPDLNPAEHLCEELEGSVNTRKPNIST